MSTVSVLANPKTRKKVELVLEASTPEFRIIFQEVLSELSKNPQDKDYVDAYEIAQSRYIRSTSEFKTKLD